MATVTEIAPDTYRISIYAPESDLQFNHFLVRDDEPLLFHTGLRRMFPDVREAVAKLIDPARIRWIGFSHFESDECGSLNQWLDIAPSAEPVCSIVGALVSVNDFANRPARGLEHGDVLPTGRYRYRFCSTAHLPHGWDAGVLFEERERTLFCSDLFHQTGDVEPLTESDVMGRVGKAARPEGGLRRRAPARVGAVAAGLRTQAGSAPGAASFERKSARRFWLTRRR